MTNPSERESRSDDQRYDAFVAAYDEALIDGSSVPALDDSTVSPELLPRIRGMRECLDLLAEGRRNGELAKALASCDTDIHDGGAGFERPFCERIGPFEIRGELGRGGYGIVFLAFDPRLGRLVALKVPRPEALVTPELRRRFLREAEAAGGLSHPNLVAVHEVGEDSPLCYIASAYCEGPTLAVWLAEQQGPVPCDDAAATIAALADGLDYAHRHGVLHRDVKPSNVLLDIKAEHAKSDAALSKPLTEFNPRLTDFGLAKLLERNDGETRSGMLMGTPAYMAPCQANGQVRDVSAATDVYGLGVVLYELLTGRPPFRGANDPDTLRQVCVDEPLPPSRLRLGLSRDLEAICLTCLAKSPSERYSSAAELARDLRRYLNGEPTVARPVHTIEKLTKWGRRHPAVAGLSAMVVVGALLSTIGGWWYSAQLSGALAEARRHEDASRTRASENQHFLYAASVNLAERALVSGNEKQALDQLARGLPQAGESDLRDFAWHHLWRQLHEEEQTLSGHSADVYCVRYAPNGRWLATASKDQTVRVWDVGSGRCLHVLGNHAGEVNNVGFSPDCMQLASACDDGNIRIWNLPGGTLARTFMAHEAGAFAVAFSPDGRRLATCGRDKSVLLWDTTDWHKTAVLVGHEGDIGAIAFSPGGETLATASDDHTVRLWNVMTGEVRSTLHGHDSDVNALAFSSDGKKVVTSGRSDRSVRIWDVATGAESKLLSRQYDWVHAVQFCLRDSHVAIATKDGDLKLVDIVTGEVFRNIHGHAVRVWSLSLSPNGQHLADASADGTVKIWNLIDGASHEDHDSFVRMSTCISQTPNGETLATGNVHAGIAVWDLAARQIRWNAGIAFEVSGDFNGDRVPDSGYFQDGIWYLQVSDEKFAEHFKEQVLRFGAIDDIPVVGDWTGDGRDHLAVFRPKKGTWYFDLDGNGGPAEEQCEFHLNQVEEYPDFEGQVPLVGRWHGQPRDRVGVARFGQGEWRFQLAGETDDIDVRIPHGDQYAVPITCRDGTDVVVAVVDRDRVWLHRLDADLRSERVADPSSEQRVRAVDDQEVTGQLRTFDQAQITSVTFNVARDRAIAAMNLGPIELSAAPRGDILATMQGNTGPIKIWDLQSGHRLHVVSTPKEKVSAFAFAPHERTLAVAMENGTLMFWDVDRCQLTGVISTHEPGMQRLAYAANGKWLATSGDEGTVKIWDAVNHHQITTLPAEVHYEIRALAFSRDGLSIAAAGTSRIITLWNWTTGQIVGQMSGHSDAINGIAFSPDGRTLASCSSDRTARLWDLDTRQELYALRDRVANLDSIAFNGAGDELISAGYNADGKRALHFWSAAEQTPRAPEVFRRLGSETRADRSSVHECRATRALAVDKQGNFLVTWHTAATESDVAVRRFDRSGRPCGDEFLINSPAQQGHREFGNDYQPPTAMNARGAAVVAWTGHRHASQSAEVWVRRLDESGAPQGEAILVSQAPDTVNFAWGIGIDDRGTFVVAYGRRLDIDANYDMDIFARRFDSNGQALGDEFRVNTIQRGPQVHCRLAMTPTGSFVITWGASQACGEIPGAYARLYDEGGKPLEAQEFVVSQAWSSGDTIGVPAVACDDTGNFIVTWPKNDVDHIISNLEPCHDLWMRRFDKHGVPLSSATLVTRRSQRHQPDYTSIAVGPRGNFVICWTGRSADSDGSTGIFARLFDAVGNPLGPAFHVPSNTDGFQECPCPGWTSADEFTISWNQADKAGGPWNSYLQRFRVAPTR